ncbi:MAG: hypothetical protein WDN44_01405 [Sphingomonas sp.]
MYNDFEGPIWADNHRAVSGAIDKLAYVVGAIIARRRSDERRARRLSEFGF